MKYCNSKDKMYYKSILADLNVYLEIERKEKAKGVKIKQKT